MAWTTPKTDFANGEAFTATQANEIGENLNYLFSPNSGYVQFNEGSDYTVSSASFVALDTTVGKGRIQVDSDGGNLLLEAMFILQADVSTTSQVGFDIRVDGVTISNGSNGICRVTVFNSNFWVVPLSIVIEGLSDGTHNIDIYWKTSAGTITLHAGTTYNSWWGVSRQG